MLGTLSWARGLPRSAARAPIATEAAIRGLGVYSPAGARPTILLPFAGATTPLAFCPSSHYGASGNATSSLLRQGPGTPNPGSPPPSGM
jgi:hypothetical protein